MRYENAANNSIGYIQCYNSISACIGLGVPWLITTCFYNYKVLELFNINCKILIVIFDQKMTKALPFSLQAKYFEFPLIFYAVLNVIYAIGLIVKRNLSIFSHSELGGTLKQRQLTAFILLLLWLIFFGLLILNSFRK